MHTLFDFITHIKGIEYIVSVTFIAGYMLYWEALKPKPFKVLLTEGKEDLDHMRKSDLKGILKNVITAPFVGLAYIAALPFVFTFMLGATALNGALSMVGKEASFGWSPVEAYLTGKKKKNTEKEEENK